MSWNMNYLIEEIRQDLFIKGRKTKFLTRNEILYYLGKLCNISKPRTQERALKNLVRFGYLKLIDGNKYELMVDSLSGD